MIPDYVTRLAPATSHSPEAATDDAEVKSGRWFCPSCHDFQSGKRCDHCGLPPPSPSSPEAVAQREPASHARLEQLRARLAAAERERDRLAVEVDEVNARHGRVREAALETQRQLTAERATTARLVEAHQRRRRKRIKETKP